MHDAMVFCRAVLTNQIARVAPRLYIELTGQTGRGAGEESPQEIAHYFKTCFDEYFSTLGLRTDEISAYLKGKRVLEYGPGDVPGVALLMLAHGAETVLCVDRFPMYTHSEKNVEVLRLLMSGLEEKKESRAKECFVKHGDPASGFIEQCLRYIVHPSGLSNLRAAADLIVSRAVLEHVNDLPATFSDMHNALCPCGVAVHLVDLESHGLHRDTALDFLTWSPRLWSWMFGYKGYINRCRIDRYRTVVTESNLQVITLRPTKTADPRDIEVVRAHLAAPFRSLSDADLSCLGFWLVCRRQD